MQNANPTAIRHPERAPARRSFGSVAKRNGQNQAPWRAGIYEGVFVTFHRQSYFFHRYGRTQCAPTSLCEHTKSLPQRGRGEHMLNSGQNTVLHAKLCRKTKSVLIGAQTILSITVKYHAWRMRRSPTARAPRLRTNSCRGALRAPA